MRFLLMGAGGFAVEVADLVETLGHEVAMYFDETVTELDAADLAGRPVVSDLSDAECDAVAIAVGDTAVRERFFEMASERFALPMLIHPTAVISPSASLGSGCLVMQNVVMNAHATVEPNVILNVGCCVAHHCSVGAHTHLAPATQMGGKSSLGSGTFCGTGTILLPGVHVGEGCVCGAGSVVTRDMPARTLSVGMPARVIKDLDPAKTSKP